MTQTQPQDDTHEQIIEELRHFCYICHNRFALLCGEPQVKVGGCCSGAIFKDTRYIRPVYAHLPCYMAKEVKRMNTIFKEPRIKLIIGAYARKQIKRETNDLKTNEDIQRYPELVALSKADIEKYRRWLGELK